MSRRRDLGLVLLALEKARSLPSVRDDMDDIAESRSPFSYPAEGFPVNPPLVLLSQRLSVGKNPPLAEGPDQKAVLLRGPHYSDVVAHFQHKGA